MQDKVVVVVLKAKVYEEGGYGDAARKVAVDVMSRYAGAGGQARLLVAEAEA